MKRVRFYGIKTAYEFMITPGQGGIDLYRKDVYAVNLKLSDEFIEQSKFPNLKNVEFLLVEIDLKTYEIVEIVELLEISASLDKDLLKETETYNRNILTDMPKMKVPKIPIPDDIYINSVIWDMLVTSILVDEYPLLIGPKGCGKTSTGRALAKALGYNFYPMNCADLMKPESTLIGTTTAKDGSTQFNESLFLKHYTSKEKTIIYLQEMSRITQNGANSLTTITEQPHSYIYIKERSELVYKGENVIFMGDANFGMEYTGTNALDGAFFDRFTPFSINYLPEKEEIHLLITRIKDLEESDAVKLVELANKIRSLGDDLPSGVSTRKLLSMAKYLAAGFTLGEVVNNIFKNLFKNGTQVESEEINNIFNSII